MRTMYEDKAKIFKTSVESLYISRGQNNMVPMRDKYFWRFLILIQDNKNDLIYRENIEMKYWMGTNIYGRTFAL